MPTCGLFLLDRLTDKIVAYPDSDRVGWKPGRDLRVITFFQQRSLRFILNKTNRSLYDQYQQGNFQTLFYPVPDWKFKEMLT